MWVNQKIKEMIPENQFPNVLDESSKKVCISPNFIIPKINKSPG